MNILVHVYPFVLLLAAVTGVVTVASGKAEGLHVKLLAYIVAFDCIAEVSVHYWLVRILHRPNLQAYNFIMLVEMMAYALFFLQIIQLPAVRKWIIGFLCIFPVFWFFMVYFVFEPQQWNSYVILAGSVFTVFWSLTYLYELVTAADAGIPLRRCFEFWAAVGLLFFYACSVPFMGIYNFLLTHSPNLAHDIGWISFSLNIVLYSFFAYAFLCKLRRG
jgi:hypothetical protein